MRSNELGTLFEKASFGLLREVFQRWGFRVLDSKIQNSGTQHGFDLYFRIVKESISLNIFVECKASLTLNTIKQSELSEKVAQLGWAGFPRKDVHIFFSPTRAIDYNNQQLRVEDDSWPFVIVDWMRRGDDRDQILSLFAAYRGANPDVCSYTDYLIKNIAHGYKTKETFEEICNELKGHLDQRIDEHNNVAESAEFRIVNGTFWSWVRQQTHFEYLHHFYTRTDSSPARLREVIANDFDVRHEKLETKFERLFNQAIVEKSALIKILSKGGEGKSTFLHRISKLYCDRHTVVLLDGLECVAEIRRRIEHLNGSGALVLLLDNAASYSQDLTEFARKLTIQLRGYRLVLVIAEREFRYVAMEGARAFEATFNETHTLEYRSRHILEQVFERFIGHIQRDSTLPREIVNEARRVFFADTRMSIAESIFSAIKFLKENDGLKGYAFDWNDWDRFARAKAPNLKRLYPVLATFYQFGFSLDLGFCASFLQDADEITINAVLNESPSLPIYCSGHRAFLRHEALAAWFFDESEEWGAKNRTNSKLIFGNFLDRVDSPVARDLFIWICIKSRDFRRSYLGSLVDDEKRVEVLEGYIQRSPRELKCRTELSKLYQRQKKWEEAILLLEEYLKIDPEGLHPRTELSKIYQRQKKWEEAILLLEEYLKIDPEGLHPRTELSKIYQRQKKWEKAESILLESLDIDAEQLHPRTELSRIYQRQKKWEKAESILLESLDIDAEQLHPRTELSKIYQRQKKWEKAESILLELLVLDPNNLQARTELSKIYQRQKKWEKAESILLKSLDIDAEQLHPRTELSKIYQRQKKWEKAESILLELLNLDPDNLQARTELSKIHQRHKEWGQAEKILLESLDIDAEDLQSRTELSKVYKRQERWKEAEDVLSEALQIDPDDRHSLLEMGKLCARELARWEEAEGYFQALLMIDPESLHGKTELSALYRKMQKWPEREKLLFEIYSAGKADVFVLSDLAWTFRRFRKYRISIKLLEQIIALRDDALLATANLMELYWIMHDKRDFEKSLSRAEAILREIPNHRHEYQFKQIRNRIDKSKEKPELISLNEVGVFVKASRRSYVENGIDRYPVRRHATVNNRLKEYEKVFFATYNSNGSTIADFVEPFFEDLEDLSVLK